MAAITIRTEVDRFRMAAKRLLQFITIREFPPANGHKLPSINKSRWWIPCATRILALLSKLKPLSRLHIAFARGARRWRKVRLATSS